MKKTNVRSRIGRSKSTNANTAPTIKDFLKLRNKAQKYFSKPIMYTGLFFMLLDPIILFAQGGFDMRGHIYMTCESPIGCSNTWYLCQNHDVLISNGQITDCKPYQKLVCDTPNCYRDRLQSGEIVGKKGNDKVGFYIFLIFIITLIGNHIWWVIQSKITK